jgi:hypothetical protein
MRMGLGLLIGNGLTRLNAVPPRHFCLISAVCDELTRADDGTGTASPSPSIHLAPLAQARTCIVLLPLP